LPAELLSALGTQRDKLAGIVLPAGLDDTTAATLRSSISASFVAGFRRVMLLCAALALLSAFSAWRLIDAPPRVSATTMRT
jgi:hypothetical protein